MNRRWSLWFVVSALSLIPLSLRAQDASGDASHDAAVVVDAAQTDTATLQDAAQPDTAPPRDAAQPDTAIPHDAATPQDAVRPDTATPHDAARPDTAAPDTAAPDFGPIDTTQPDRTRPDTGPCVSVCVDEHVLHQCSTDGVLVTLQCPAEFMCKDARCVAVEPTDGGDDGCTCSSSGSGAAAALAFALCAVWFGCIRRRRQ